MPNIYKMPKNLEPEASHGLSMEQCQPIVVTALVVDYSEEKTENCSMDEEGGKHRNTFSGNKYLMFLYERDGEKYHSRETFKIGDIVPEIGQWVRGVVVTNQWGSTKFVTTHLLSKPKKVR